MKRKVFFCKSWFRAKKKPTETWTIDQARYAHENGEPYVVLIDSQERPYCFLEVTKKYIGVFFLDQCLRENLSYEFQGIEDGQLFLREAIYREFDSDTDRVVSGSSYRFERDGKVNVRSETYFPEHFLETFCADVNVSKNFAQIPLFGEYEDLIVAERVKSMGSDSIDLTPLQSQSS
jgi:hypothetical protein